MIEDKWNDNWIQTYSGNRYWPLSPRAKDVDIKDIAHALAMSCRFSGHCVKFYSVAEHSCHVSDACEDIDKLWGLLHDAAEAYVTDVPRPIKPFLTNYKEIENRNMNAIVHKFNLLPFKIPESVKKIDTAILADEQKQVMNPSEHAWYLPESPLDVRIEFWEPERAEIEFLNRFHELYNGAH